MTRLCVYDHAGSTSAGYVTSLQVTRTVQCEAPGGTTGRPCGVLPKVDGGQPLTTCTLGGPDHSVLYIAHGTAIYRRKLTVEKAK